MLNEWLVKITGKNTDRIGEILDLMQGIINRVKELDERVTKIEEYISLAEQQKGAD